VGRLSDDLEVRGELFVLERLFARRFVRRRG
jgi:hypothetical protein